jgi:Fur family ferric uptake transcriptional regulator
MQEKKFETAFKTYLRKNKLRITRERMGVLKAICQIPTHFSAELLFQQLEKQKSGISLATVYNTLEHLLKAGVIRQYRFGHHSLLYEATIEHRQHDHLICNNCGHVAEFCDPRIQHIQDRIGRLLGFHITGHSLFLLGECLLLKDSKTCPHFNQDRVALHPSKPSV